MRKKAIVTGGSRGIGRGIVKKLVEEGYDVAFSYSTKKEEAEKLCKELQKENVNIWCQQSDMSIPENGEIFFEQAVKVLGGLDLLVNNAGITRDGLLMRMSEEAFDSVIDTNLKGTFHCMRFAARQMMKQRSGRIINLSSIVGVAGNAGQTNYAASKAGVIGLTKAAAKELASRKITVNAVAPGFIETDMTARLPEKIREQTLLQIPAGSFGKAEDVAHAVVFLASEEAGYITGQVLHVDGGMAM